LLAASFVAASLSKGFKMEQRLKMRELRLATLVIAGCLLMALAVSGSFGSSRVSSLIEQESQAHPGPYERTKSRIERGRYLAEGPARCFMCHSDLDWKTPGAPPLPGKKGAGGVFPEEGLPIQIVSPNITPDKEAGLGNWTDEEIGRAIREGNGKKGRALIPFMPFASFNALSDEDLASIVVYLRSLKPAGHKPPEMVLPDGIAARLKPMTLKGPVPQPDNADPVKRGAYLARLSNCSACHTPVDEKGRRVPGFDSAGGLVIKGAWGVAASTNLTPDPTGIGMYDEALFITLMRTGKVGGRQVNSIMPWGYYRHMTDEDLKAIFAYLGTLKPVAHRVNNAEPPRKCSRCGKEHGYRGADQ
jgi:mono/diheme cytochrome c family protein